MAAFPGKRDFLFHATHHADATRGGLGHGPDGSDFGHRIRQRTFLRHFGGKPLGAVAGGCDRRMVTDGKARELVGSGRGGNRVVHGCRGRRDGENGGL